MSQKKAGQTPTKTSARPATPLPVQQKEQKSWFPHGSAAASIPNPLIWLGLLAMLMYLPTLWFGFTELDDSIFIREFRDYNEDIRNLVTSFQRGLFDATKDPYYRPVFHDSVILNFQLFKEEVGGYHFFNVLLHVTSVLLLYKVLVKLKIREFHAFLLAAIYAVHPVISQAVAWIPGRNDTLLAVFTLSFFIQVFNFTEHRKMQSLGWSVLFLLLAFFTKETAVFVPPAAFVLIVFGMGRNWLDRDNLKLYGSWAGVFLVWFVARRMATVQSGSMNNIAKMAGDFLHRTPLVIQYLGKIFLPFNLSVFPIQEDTVYYFGFAAVAILGALLFFSKEVNWRIVGIGFGFFILFLVPALLVPNNLNEQTFEHRLYLPLIGILLVLTQTVPFKKLSDRNLLIGGAVLCLLLGVVNYFHQKNFTDPFAFWHQAAETSPHSAYATMMLAAREEGPQQQMSYDMYNSDERKALIKTDAENLQLSFSLFRKAYSLNPKEKYLNYYYGVMLQKKDSVLASEPYLLAEKNTSGYYECDFYLARVAMMKHDTIGSMNYLKNFITKVPTSPQANNNLLLMYYTRGQIAEAKALAAKMQTLGLTVPPELMQRLNSIR